MCGCKAVDTQEWSVNVIDSILSPISWRSNPLVSGCIHVVELAYVTPFCLVHYFSYKKSTIVVRTYSASKLPKCNERGFCTRVGLLLHVLFHYSWNIFFLPLRTPFLIVSAYTSATRTLVTFVFVLISVLLAISMINMYDLSC